ncbi:hypothetical protein AB835_14405 [Candidatus Endobugula sertula]|uniref:Transposase Synechocystis PCC 6803 domain-containing protein n=1 Tax=Candidatus Endobugula sertula TaxID=62101 RepID=A0A1D2QLE1_9GAMM|nr:hypothetical protein AB835_14405 [Candidatus Endobugula sertula]
MEKLVQPVKDYPDAYLRERAEVLGVSFQAVYYALKVSGEPTTIKSQGGLPFLPAKPKYP